MPPTFILEIEFVPGVWTNVSSYLRTGSTKRGKAFAIDKVAPGRMTLELSNRSREFDPEYASNISPGNVVPEKRVRLKVTHNGITYPVFAGHIDRISQDYNAGNDTARLECSDGLAHLSSGRIGSAWEVTMKNYSPRLWFRLNEQGRGTKVYDRSPNNLFGIFAGPGTAVEGAPSLIAEDEDSAIRFKATTQYVQLGASGDLPAVAPWSISFLMNVPGPPAAGAVVAFLRPNDPSNGLSIYMDSAGKVVAEIKVGNVGTHYVKTANNYSLGTAAWMVTLTAEAGLPLKLHIWGGENETATGTLGTGGTFPVATHVLGVTPVEATMDEFVVFAFAPTAAQLADLTLGMRGWNADVPATRIGRILDAVGWPAAERNIAPEYDQLLRATGLGSTVLAHLEALGSTMLARLFVQRDGTLRFLSRQQFSQQPFSVSAVTLGDAPGEVGYSEVGNYSLDLARVQNVIRRLWNGYPSAVQTTVEVSDPTSIAAYKVRAGAEVSSEFLEIGSEETLARARLGRLKTPVPSVEGLKVVPVTNAQWATVLGRELADRITWKRRPRNIGAPIEKEVVVEGIAHAFGPKRWTTTFLVDATDSPPTLIWTTDKWGESWA